MPKRQNRIPPLRHEYNQLENLKSLEPIATPPENKVLSDALLDLAMAAINEAIALEEQQAPDKDRLDTLRLLAEQLPILVNDS